MAMFTILPPTLKMKGIMMNGMGSTMMMEMVIWVASKPKIL
jgi:hypothetical protein